MKNENSKKAAATQESELKNCVRKTKIVCTLGPATDDYAKIKAMILAGMNVARVNMSHGPYDEQSQRIAWVKKAREELDKPVAILLDSKGPEIRIQRFKNGRVILKEGDKFTLTTEDVAGDEKRVSITYPLLPQKIKKGTRLLIDDGFIGLEVIEITKKDIVCLVKNGGALSDRKSINIPNVPIDMPYMSDIDEKDFLFGIEQGVDFIALSFVRSVNDVNIAKEFLAKNKGEDIQLISKIENQEGVNNLEEIVKASDGVMVARGDMGVEIDFEKLPKIQKKMIKMCYKRGKKVITATQMLESMTSSPRPTRAEASDVANAIYDGTSATMLSGETAIGKHVIGSIETMAKIAIVSESDIDYKKRFRENQYDINSISMATSYSAVMASISLDAKAIVAVSSSGDTIRNISCFRPQCPIVGVTTSPKVYYQLALNWGVVPAMSEKKESSDELFEHAIESAKKTGVVKTGDLVIFVAGIPVGQRGSTNSLRMEYVK